jgi:hypothetical protein
MLVNCFPKRRSAKLFLNYSTAIASKIKYHFFTLHLCKIIVPGVLGKRILPQSKIIKRVCNFSKDIMLCSKHNNGGKQINFY